LKERYKREEDKDLKERRRFWKLKEEALDRAVLRTRFGRGNGPVVKHYVKMKEFFPFFL